MYSYTPIKKYIRPILMNQLFTHRLYKRDTVQTEKELKIK